MEKNQKIFKTWINFNLETYAYMFSFLLDELN